LQEAPPKQTVAITQGIKKERLSLPVAIRVAANAMTHFVCVSLHLLASVNAKFTYS